MSVRDSRIGLLLRTIAIGSLSGAAAGVVAGGIGGRIAMRISAVAAGNSFQGALTEADNRVGEITFGGTVGLVIFGGVLSGVIGGLIYLGVRQWLAELGAWRGLAFGLLLLVAFGWIIITGDNFDFSTFGPPLLNIGMFALIFIVFGLLLVPLHDWMERQSSRPTRGMLRLVSEGAQGVGLLLAAVVAFSVVGAGGFGRGINAVLSTLVLAYAIVLMPLARLLLSRAAGRFQGLSELWGKWRWLVVAVTVLALPVALGVVMDVREVTDILRTVPKPQP